MKHLEIIIHSDPGHAWAEVDKTLLKELGIRSQISGYSYQKDDKVFLEEDCDLPKFIQAWEAAGNTYSFTELHKENTPIRNYPKYKPLVLAAVERF